MKRIVIMLTLCCFAIVSNSIGQDWNTGGNAISGTEFLGAINTSTIPLDIKTIPNLSIRFFTSNSLRLSILGTGETGIGITPSYRLDVQDNINLRPGAFGDGYRWWDGSTGRTILHTNAATSNIFLGGGSGI